jgi:predicted TPR repeat methyltransferase
LIPPANFTDPGAAARTGAHALLGRPPVDAMVLLPLLMQAQEYTPHDDIPATLDLADLLLDTGQNIAVLERLSVMARRLPDRMRAFVEVRLGHANRALGHDGMAQRHYQTAAALAPDICANQSRASAGRDPQDDVQGLFNVFAERFDEHLAGRLRYSLPQMIGDLLQEVGTGHNLDILDAGCGTGLCQPVLSPYASRLDGCDLSLNMLAKARQRGGYRHLWWSDLLAFLPGRPDGWDMIVAADVLIYISDIDALFRHATSALRRDGRFLFSLLSSNGADMERRPDGHYHHGDSYIQTLATANGLSVRSWQQVIPRYEQGQPLDGRLVMLQKP